MDKTSPVIMAAKSQRCCICNGPNAICKNCSCSKKGSKCSSCCPKDRGTCRNIVIVTNTASTPVVASHSPSHDESRLPSGIASVSQNPLSVSSDVFDIDQYMMKAFGAKRCRDTVPADTSDN